MYVKDIYICDINTICMYLYMYLNCLNNLISLHINKHENINIICIEEGGLISLFLIQPLRPRNIKYHIHI